MKNSLLSAAVMGLAVVAAQSNALFAQTPAEPSTSGKPQTSKATPQEPVPEKTSDKAEKKDFLNGALPKWLHIGGTIRGRWEEGIVNLKGNVTDGYYLDRVRLDLTLAPAGWFSVYAQLQDTRVWGYNHGVPAGTMQDPFDLRQGYVQLGGGEGSGQWVRAGRQEVIYGAGRVMSSSDWETQERPTTRFEAPFTVRASRSSLLRVLCSIPISGVSTGIRLVSISMAATTPSPK